MLVITLRYHRDGVELRGLQLKRFLCGYLRGLLDSIKVEANKRDMPYQSLIKAWLAEDLKESRKTYSK